MNQLSVPSMDTARQDANAFIHEASETVRNAGKYKLEVLSGFHEGASMALDTGSITIGSSPDNAIVLFADTIPARHVTVDLPSNVLKNITVSPVEKSILLEDGSVVEVGQYAEISAGESFFCDETEICINRYVDPKSIGRIGIRVLAIICLLAMLPIAYSVFSGMISGVASASSAAISVFNDGISNPKTFFTGTGSASDRAQLDSFAWTARTKL
ncbi:MAG: FHA domain-containing protein, partial [Pseudomonadota bacterium]